MKTAVVTGAGGFVGSAVVRELLAQGVQVISLVHREETVPAALEGSRIFKWEMTEPCRIADTLSAYQPEVWYHFAWTGSAGPLRSDERVQLQNVQGACDSVRLAAGAGCSKYVFASSIMEYEMEAEIKSMGHPGINSLYSAAKTAADHMTRILAASLNMGYVSGLISNIYGPEEHSPRLVNSSIRKLLKGERLSLSPGTQLYDFLYIDDAARMFAAIGDAGRDGRTYYLGNPKPRPLRAFMEELRDVVAPGTELGFGDLPFNGASLTYQEFDTELLYRDTGRSPLVPFGEGVARTRDWILQERE